MSSHSSIASLYRSHTNALRSFIKSRVRCRETAAELVQETFLRMLKLEEQSLHNPVGLAYQVARNLAIDHARHARTIPEHESSEFILEELADHNSDPEMIAYKRQRLRQMEEAIAELSPQCRRVFVLHRFGGFTQAEVAGQLGISRQMVERHISKALLYLHSRLDESRTA